MPPRRSARAAAAAAAPTPPPVATAAAAPTTAKYPIPLRGCRIAVSGALPGLTHEDVLEKAKALGAATTQNVTATVTHLITTEQEVRDETPKVRAVKKWNKARMVAMDWLEKCEEDGEHVKEDEYELKPDVSAPSSKASAKGSAKGKGKAANGGKAANDTKPAVNGTKRAASPIPAPANKKSKKDGELQGLVWQLTGRRQAARLALEG